MNAPPLAGLRTGVPPAFDESSRNNQDRAANADVFEAALSRFDRATAAGRAGEAAAEDSDATNEQGASGRDDVAADDDAISAGVNCPGIGVFCVRDSNMQRPASPGDAASPPLAPATPKSARASWGLERSSGASLAASSADGAGGESPSAESPNPEPHAVGLDDASAKPVSPGRLRISTQFASPSFARALAHGAPSRGPAGDLAAALRAEEPASAMQTEPASGASDPAPQTATVKLTVASFETHFPVAVANFLGGRPASLHADPSSPGQVAVDPTPSPASVQRGDSPVKVLTFEMEPAMVGPIQIRMKISRSRVELQMAAGTSDALSLLEGSRKQLSAAIAGTGYEIDSILIQVSPALTPSGNISGEGLDDPSGSSNAGGSREFSGRDDGSAGDPGSGSRPQGSPQGHKGDGGRSLRSAGGARVSGWYL
jgi:hypothetical protein